MKDYIIIFSVILNIAFGFVIRYENKLYNDEFKRAEFCIGSAREAEKETLKWRKHFIDQVKR